MMRGIPCGETVVIQYHTFNLYLFPYILHTMHSNRKTFYRDTFNSDLTFLRNRFSHRIVKIFISLRITFLQIVINYRGSLRSYTRTLYKNKITYLRIGRRHIKQRREMQGEQILRLNSKKLSKAECRRC